MKMLFGLDPQVEKLINRKQKEHNVLIILSAENEKTYMSVAELPNGKIYENQLVSDCYNKDSVCVGIMKWFKTYNR